MKEQLILSRHLCTRSQFNLENCWKNQNHQPQMYLRPIRLKKHLVWNSHLKLHLDDSKAFIMGSLSEKIYMQGFQHPVRRISERGFRYVLTFTVLMSDLLIWLHTMGLTPIPT